MNDVSKFPQLFASEVVGLQQLPSYIQLPPTWWVNYLWPPAIAVNGMEGTGKPDAAFCKTFGEALGSTTPGEYEAVWLAPKKLYGCSAAGKCLCSFLPITAGYHWSKKVYK